MEPRQNTRDYGVGWHRPRFDDRDAGISRNLSRHRVKRYHWKLVPEIGGRLSLAIRLVFRASTNSRKGTRAVRLSARTSARISSTRRARAQERFRRAHFGPRRNHEPACIAHPLALRSVYPDLRFRYSLWLERIWSAHR